MVGEVQVLGLGVFQVLCGVVLGGFQGISSVNRCFKCVLCTGAACVSGG